MQEHTDNLKGLAEQIPLSEKLFIIHNTIKNRFNFIDRISVAMYDAKTETVKTFLANSEQCNTLVCYEAPLESTGSLKEIIKIGHPRVINDLSIFDQNGKEHTQKIKAQGYNASYTMPLYNNGNLSGFVFFNSREKYCFNELVLKDLDIFSHLILAILNQEMGIIKTLHSALKISSEMVHLRDPETGQHLERMARFSRLIAQGLATYNKYRFSDEYIEQIFLFAPLHDVGKIGIPDDILLKPARLDEQEFKVMQTHTTKGIKIINDVIARFGFESFSSIDMLRNIIEYHHEAMDGSGYPNKMKGSEIPIEARIVAVADIFDALTSRRSYKAAWDNDRAFLELQKLSGDKLDRDCVEAFINSRKKVELLQTTFKEPESLIKQIIFH